MANNFYYSSTPYNSQQGYCSCSHRHNGCHPSSPGFPCPPRPPFPPFPPFPPTPPSPPGSISTTIPFSISQNGASFTTDEQGNPLTVNFAGFGSAYYMSEMLEPGEWATGTITFRESMPFGTSFIMPRNAVLKNIYALFSTNNGTSFEPGVVITPFVCLAVSNSANLVYTVLQETITNVEPYLGGVLYPKHTLRRGAITGLNTSIAEGSLLAVVAGMRAQNASTEQFAMLSASGGLLFE